MCETKAISVVDMMTHMWSPQRMRALQNLQTH